MYSAAIPSYDADEKTDDKLEDLDWGGEMDMSNPDNFKDTDNRPQRI